MSGFRKSKSIDSAGIISNQNKTLEGVLSIICKANRETYLSYEDTQQFEHAYYELEVGMEENKRCYLRDLGLHVNELYKVSVPLQTETLSKEKWDELNRKHIEILHWFHGQEEFARELFNLDGHDS